MPQHSGLGICGDEPGSYPAVLFIGNTYFRKNDFARAEEWYEKAIRLDPNIEIAYRYYAEMLGTKEDMAGARSMLIHAAVAEPYNRMVWRDLMTWATLNETRITFRYAGVSPDPKPLKPPDPKAARKAEPLFDVKLFPQRPKDLSDAWQAYQSVQESWKEGSKFKQQFPRKPGTGIALPRKLKPSRRKSRSWRNLRVTLRPLNWLQRTSPCSSF